MKIVNSVDAFLACAVASLLFAMPLCADTIIKNDGKEMRGIVVEDYRDRLVFSTVDGEVSVMKSDIRELTFDSDEDNFVKMAERATDKRDYSRAMGFYNMALKANPDSNAAKQGMAYLRGSIFRKEEDAKSANIRRQQEIELYGNQAPLRSEAGGVEGMMDSLEKATGMRIAITDYSPTVTVVLPRSPAFEAGIRKGDTLISVWGKLSGYLPLKDILDLLISRSAIEIRCVIERIYDVSLNPNKTVISGPEDLIGAAFAMEFDGLVISDVKDSQTASYAGIRKGDHVMAVDGKPTRYMPLKKAIELIRNIKSDTVKLTIRREATIWRRGEI